MLNRSVMSNEITDFKKMVSRLEAKSLKLFKENVETLRLDLKKAVLKMFSSIKEYHERNLKLFPKLTDNAQPHFLYIETEKKLKAINSKGKYLYNLIPNNNG